MENYDSTILLPDEPPSNGVWVDPCDVLANPTVAEMDAGNDAGLASVTDGFDAVATTINTFISDPDKHVAMEKAIRLKAVMLKYGVPEVRIELLPGRPSPYGVWDAGFFVSDMSHHTVSRYSRYSLTPVLNLCKTGRSDLPGPLCNGYGGYDLTYRIFTFGYANHPGAGGSITVPALTAGRFTIPKDSARRYTWGTEWEGGLSEADWDRVLTNPRNGKKMTMREFMGRANAALEEFLAIHEDAHLEHSTWTSRKIDRLGYTQAEGIAEKKKYKINPAPKKTLTVNLKNVRTQFLNHSQGKRVKRLPGVRKIRRALNAKYGHRLPIHGKVDDALVQVWRFHEREVGVSGKPGIPDPATLSALTSTQFRMKVK